MIRSEGVAGAGILTAHCTSQVTRIYLVVFWNGADAFTPVETSRVWLATTGKEAIGAKACCDAQW